MSGMNVGPVEDSNAGTLKGLVGIVVIGIALGAGYNFVGMRSEPAFGIPWITVDEADEDVVIGASSGGNGENGSMAGGVPEIEPEAPVSDDPMSVLLGASAGLPSIPVMDRPVQIQLPVAKQFFDADAALFIDAREPEEYRAGHVPGAISLPFDTAITDPALLESLPAQGRPIIVYCGGAGCEVSRKIAEELLMVGHTRVTYFMGGFPGWQDSGFPVATGEE